MWNTAQWMFMLLESPAAAKQYVDQEFHGVVEAVATDQNDFPLGVRRVKQVWGIFYLEHLFLVWGLLSCCLNSVTCVVSFWLLFGLVKAPRPSWFRRTWLTSPFSCPVDDETVTEQLVALHVPNSCCQRFVLISAIIVSCTYSHLSL